MSEHVSYWIPGYHDGELNPALRSQVEAHLEECPDCRARLADLRALSALLRDDPHPAASEPADRFAERLVQRLPQRKTPVWQMMIPHGLRYAPLALFAAWAFFQAASWVTGGLLLAISLSPTANQIFSALLPLVPAAPGTGIPQLNLLAPLLGIPRLGELTSGLPWLDGLGWITAVNIALMVGLAGLFFGWLAAWWAFVRKQNKETVYGSHSNSAPRV